VSAAPIDKLALLELLNEAYAAEVAVTPRDEPRIDRSLDSTAFREVTGYVPPMWADMVRALAADPTPYEAARALS
jgi:dTDP-4-dehydrorhamnose reductase